MPGRSAIGLDIGTTAVRAAQLSQSRNAVTLERFGEIPLPPGAVRDGEVDDGELVAGAVKQLWRETRLGSRKVVLGVANQRVVVQLVDLPWIPRPEIRQTLPFHVQDLIPMPVEAALLDFHMLYERTDETGTRSMSGLLVAAAREMVLASVESVEASGLRVVAVDLSSFALIRALAWPSAHAAYVPAQPAAGVPPPRPADPTQPDTLLPEPPPPQPPSAQPPPAQSPTLELPPVEALVDVGARVTNVVVHRGGVPLFVRILLMGGQNIVDSVCDRTGTDPVQADEIVRTLGVVRPDVTPIAQTEPAARAIEVAVSELVDEVRGSLDYFVTSSGSPAVSRILLGGGSARMTGLAQRLAEGARTAVDYAHPLAGLNTGGVRMPPEVLSYLEPTTSVAIGLARGAAA